MISAPQGLEDVANKLTNNAAHDVSEPTVLS